MGRGLDLEALKEIFRDNRIHIAVAQVEKVLVASDRSFVRVQVSVLPEKRTIFSKMTWEATGPDSGFFQLPVAGDLVLIGQAEGDDEQAFVIRRLTSKVDTIPLRAAQGHLVARALALKKAWLTSDTRINLSRGNIEPTENLVLGQKLKTFLEDFLDFVSDLAIAVSTHDHVGNLGVPTSPPQQAADFTQLSEDLLDLKTTDVTSEDILSDVSFTEK